MSVMRSAERVVLRGARSRGPSAGGSHEDLERVCLANLLASTEERAFFKDLQSQHSNQWNLLAGTFLIQFFCYNSFALDAAAVYRAMQGHKLEPSAETLLRLVRTLTKANSCEVVNALVVSLGSRMENKS